MKRLIFLLVPILILSCTKKETDILVKVGGSTLTLKEFKKYVPETELKKLTNENIKAYLTNWADQEVLYLQAQKEGIDREDSVRMVLDQYKKNLLAMEVVRRAFGNTTVTDVEINDYFGRHAEEYLYSVKLGQIVMSSADAAYATLAEIKSGADFFKLARERSLARLENPDNPAILTDYMPRGRLGDYAIEEVIFKMNPGDISDVIPYLQGTFLIVKMVDKKRFLAKAELTDEIRNQIYNYLMSKKYREFLTSLVDSLKTNAYKVTIDLAPLKK